LLQLFGKIPPIQVLKREIVPKRVDDLNY